MQCRVLDYGVPKLINLFNYNSDIVEIGDESDNRIIRLRLKHRLPILADQLTSLAKGTFLGQILLEDLPKEYLNKYGYPLRAETYNVQSIEEAVKLVSDQVCILEIIYLSIYTLYIKRNKAVVLCLMQININTYIYQNIYIYIYI